MSVDMSQHFRKRDLLKYTIPSMATMVFTSVYSIVDGLFISNFVGTTAFAAVNLVMPLLMGVGVFGTMLGTGGGAIVAKTRGEGDDARANRYFSLLAYAALVLGVILAIVGIVVLKPFSIAMGATGQMLDDCMEYGVVFMAAMPFFVSQYAFQSFFMTAGKPQLGFAASIGAGVTNIVLDALFVAVFGWGLAGAAVASALGMVVGGVFPLIYFARKNSSCLKLGKTRVEWSVLGKACVNGSSEMVTNLAFNLVAVAYNLQLMRFFGEDGVAAYGVIMYVGMIFGALYFGYAVASAPLMSFQFGAQNKVEMQSLFRKGIFFVVLFGVLMLGAAQATAPVVAGIFVGYDAGLSDFTEFAFRLYSIAFLFMGFSIFGSMLFTSLNNGLVSALISFLRTLLFEVGAVMLLPILIGPNGIWLAVVVAELVSVAVTGIFMLALGEHYGYLKGRANGSNR